MPYTRIIVNPASGRGAGERSIPIIESRLKASGVDFDLQCTTRPWHAAELARQAAQEGVAVVAGAGGDGTANEIINGLMLARQEGADSTALGMLPVGRGNDFAYSMGLPLELEAACRCLAQDLRRKIDIGRVTGGDYPQGRYFGNGIGVGFDAVVGFVALKLTYLSGFPSYIAAALQTIFLYYTAPRLHLQTDDQSFDQRCLMVSVMNGRRMGGGFMMAPEARSDDGLLDLCIARQVSRLRIIQLIPYFMQGSQATQPEIRTLRTQTLSIQALEGVLPAHADGETLCVEGKQLTVESLPNQIELVSPKRAEAG
jgi:diacylglycerol kinase (ATP)